jgi:hypothetical protein
MIQATQESNFNAYINTEANRIDTSVSSAHIRHLFKFINDLDGSVFYAYGDSSESGGTPYGNERFTYFHFVYDVTPNRYNSLLNLTPAGYYKYEVYEVSWIADFGDGVGEWLLNEEFAPATETAVFSPPANTLGVVQGLVAIGKLYLSEIDSEEEVQYIQNAQRVQTLTIQFGGTGYTSAPSITIAAPTLNGGKTATATCTVAGGVVNTVTIDNPGSGYETNPVVTLSGGGFTEVAIITANIEETNYIYYGQ